MWGWVEGEADEIGAALVGRFDFEIKPAVDPRRTPLFTSARTGGLKERAYIRGLSKGREDPIRSYYNLEP